METHLEGMLPFCPQALHPDSLSGTKFIKSGLNLLQCNTAAVDQTSGPFRSAELIRRAAIMLRTSKYRYAADSLSG